MKKLIAGNWKLNGDADMAERFDTDIADIVKDNPHVEWLVCPPYPYIASLSHLQRGAQDCSAHDKGAYTGEVAATMLADMGCTYCIVGHSERRAHFGEDNVLVKQKAAQLLKQNIKPIICVGETLEEREQGKAVDVVQSQITESLPDGAHAENTVIAYEPVWAIGTGKAASLCDITKMHSAIRDHLKSLLADGAEMRILYGGSVKPDNAQDILNSENVGGALIGGASLKADDFAAIGMAVKN
jgi:triosephosphate isomerase